jgi:hypothetical protein
MRRFITIATALAALLVTNAANAEVSDTTLKWGLSTLKDISGVIGGAMACKNQEVHDDSAKTYRAALKALIKNGVIKEEDAQTIFDMNSKTAATVEKDFLRDSPISCAELPKVWDTMKEELGIN